MRDDTAPLPPQNIEAEQAVLGAILSDATGAAWRRVSARLKADHFAEYVHARIYSASAAMFSSGEVASPLTLKSQFDADDTLKGIGGASYLARLTAAASPSISLPSHAAIIVDMAVRRQAMQAARDLTEAAASVDAVAPFRAALGEHVAACQGLFEGGSERRTTYSLAEAGAAMIERVNRIRAGEADHDAIATGIGELDRFLGGLHRGEYVILGGRPSMGKTATAVQLAANVAERGGGVAYFSLEMPASLLMPRFASAKLFTPGAHSFDYVRILRGELDDRQARWLAEVTREMSSWPLVIDDAPGLSPAELEARAQVIKAKFENSGKRLDLVICDHVHRLRAPGSLAPVHAYTEISARLAEMAKRLDCPVLALAQLNRAVESRDDKRPQLADLRESGSIEQDADVVMFCYRPAYYLERKRIPGDDPSREADRMTDLDAVRHRLELIIEKQRSGPIGTIELWADMGANVVRDPADIGEEARAA